MPEYNKVTSVTSNLLEMHYPLILFLILYNQLYRLYYNSGNYILIYTNYVKTLHYICILCKKLLY